MVGSKHPVLTEGGKTGRQSTSTWQLMVSLGHWGRQT